MIRFFTFAQFHNKKGIGSTRLRVEQLLKHWPEAGIYKYGENPDVLIFQKVYCTEDYKLPALYEGITILDVADPDWLDNSLIKETVDGVDAVTTCTEPLAEFIRQLTDKPVKVIPDRHDLDNLPKVKKHEGKGKKLVWFGYRHNAELLRLAIWSLEKTDFELTVISEQNPDVHRFAQDPNKYKDKVKFVKFNADSLYKELQKADIALLPEGQRPRDRFKSNNKTVICHLAGLPVAKNMEDLNRLQDSKVRQAEADKNRAYAEKEYNVIKSVDEYKELIEELKGEHK